MDVWDGKLGEMEDSGIIGRFGSGKHNDALDQLMKFCEDNTLFIANTWFKQY